MTTTCPKGCHTFRNGKWYRTWTETRNGQIAGHYSVLCGSKAYCFASDAKLTVVNGKPVVTEMVSRAVATLALYADCGIGRCPVVKGCVVSRSTEICAERRLAWAERQAKRDAEKGGGSDVGK